ncbi:MAG TPA: SpoIID/LytB domain-containing protein [Myxococcales bacterium]|nr:SpoIID/LytB domain-containing protein [Myxococcales bacterium]
MVPLALVLALTHASTPGLPGISEDDSEDIRILVGRGEGTLLVGGSGLQISVGGRWSQLEGSELRVSCSLAGLRLPGIPDAPGLAVLRAIGPLRVGSSELRGSLEVRCQGRRWLAINVLPLEEYLVAVLGGEMPPTFPAQALEAQAVAARSYALHRKVEAMQQGLLYHLDSTVLSQVYGGMAREDGRTRAAVEATRGEVLAYGMLPVEAYFHASCGGRTETGAAALGRDEPYLVSVSCPGARRSPYAHWTVRVTPAELGRLARPLVGSGEVTGLRVVSRTATGRARTLQLSTTEGLRTVAATQLRAALGYVRLPSLWFDVHGTDGVLVFEGQGAGHGAGLCQWGARVLAEEGQGYREILAHYYPGTELRKIY